MKATTGKRSLGATLAGAMLVLSLTACGESPAASVPTPPPQPTATITTAVEETTTEPTASGADSGWTTFTSDEAGFSVDMAGQPTSSNQSTDSPLGQLTFYFFKVVDGDNQYVVSYNDYPVSEEDLSSPDLLQSGIQGAAQGAEVENIQNVDVQGYSGIEGEMTAQGSTHVWYRAILVKTRLYQLIASAPESDKDAHADLAHRFIDSFVLLNP